MKYVALLRGINVGTSRRMDMKTLVRVFESLGATDVASYINSGNVWFTSTDTTSTFTRKLEAACKKTFGFDTRILIKSLRDMQRIAKAIPADWTTDAVSFRADVAYLFPEVSEKTLLPTLPIQPNYTELITIKGAILWRFDRKNIHKTRLNKLISHPAYQHMTIRNLNTARTLAAGAKIKTTRKN